MGVNGLLKLLSSITVEKHLSEYSGQTVAIDGYCWLHRSLFSCRDELFNDIDTDQ